MDEGLFVDYQMEKFGKKPETTSVSVLCVCGHHHIEHLDNLQPCACRHEGCNCSTYRPKYDPSPYQVVDEWTERDGTKRVYTSPQQQPDWDPDEGLYEHTPTQQPCPDCGRTLTWHEKEVGRCFKCNPAPRQLRSCGTCRLGVAKVSWVQCYLHMEAKDLDDVCDSWQPHEEDDPAPAQHIDPADKIIKEAQKRITIAVNIAQSRELASKQHPCNCKDAPWLHEHTSRMIRFDDTWCIVRFPFKVPQEKVIRIPWEPTNQQQPECEYCAGTGEESPTKKADVPLVSCHVCHGTGRQPAPQNPIKIGSDEMFAEMDRIVAEVEQQNRGCDNCFESLKGPCGLPDCGPPEYPRWCNRYPGEQPDLINLKEG